MTNIELFCQKNGGDIFCTFRWGLDRVFGRAAGMRSIGSVAFVGDSGAGKCT